MSWLARSLANSLQEFGNDAAQDRIDEEDDDDDDEDGSRAASGQTETPTSRGVKDDISELTRTLTRQFWGVASYIAPPPTPAIAAGDSEPSDPPPIMAQIGGRFRTGISRLSNNAAVSEISKIASNFLPFGSETQEEEEEVYYGVGAVGVTEEVMAFVRNIGRHPETWLDFPLFHDEEDCDDFDMSDAQQEHALSVEHLAPRLAALRIELCPSHMSEGCFWKIYFVLLHSRLSKHDAELLSTPQIAEARAMLLQKLQSQTKLESGSASFRSTDYTLRSPSNQVTAPSNTLYENAPSTVHEFKEETTSIPITDLETEKHRVLTSEATVVDESVIQEEPLAQLNKEVDKYYEDDEGDDWLEEENGELGASGGTTIHFVNEEDVSFSDLEEDR